MPSREVHRMDAKIFGYSQRVNRLIDGPWNWLGGGHRVLFHDEGMGPNSAIAIGAIADGARGAFGGMRHRYLDTLCSENHEIRDALELIARMRPRSRKVGAIMIKGSSKGTYKRVYYYKKAD